MDAGSFGDRREQRDGAVDSAGDWEGEGVYAVGFDRGDRQCDLEFLFCAVCEYGAVWDCTGDEHRGVWAMRGVAAVVYDAGIEERAGGGGNAAAEDAATGADALRDDPG